MIVVRYAALVALVVWVGGLATLLLPGSGALEPLDAFAWTELACGAVVLVGYLLLKFIGPPPEAFFIRFSLAALMLAVAAYSAYAGASRPGSLATCAIGFVLLGWYVRE
jgi:hypothetical protein